MNDPDLVTSLSSCPLHTLIRPNAFQCPKFVMLLTSLCISSKFDCCASKRGGGRALICSIWQFPWCKYFSPWLTSGYQCVATEQGIKKRCTQLALASGSLPAPAYCWTKSYKSFRLGFSCLSPWEGFLDHAICFYCSLSLACSHTYHVILQFPAHFSPSLLVCKLLHVGVVSYYRFSRNFQSASHMVVL